MSLINCDKLLTSTSLQLKKHVFSLRPKTYNLCDFVDQYIQLREKTEENVKSSSVIQINVPVQRFVFACIVCV